MLSCIGLAATLSALAALGYLDYRYRRVDHEWLYAIILVGGSFIDIGWIEKLVCLTAVPLTLILTANVISKRKGCPITDVVGGADIKTIACVGYSFGISMLTYASLLSIVFSLFFLIQNKQKGDNAGIPLCTTLAAGVFVVYLFIPALFRLAQLASIPAI